VVFFVEERNASIVIVIQHPDDMLSVYRYNGVSTVEKGDIVKTGQLIGKGLTAPMKIDFELWIKGKPVNPENHITF
jgi:murein DD-endopeptidase MepM/ murein hydrolase activator NlpD